MEIYNASRLSILQWLGDYKLKDKISSLTVSSSRDEGGLIVQIALNVKTTGKPGGQRIGPSDCEGGRVYPL